jgi:hypothetical protein
MSLDGLVYYLWSTATLLNNEIIWYAITTWWLSMSYPTAANTWIWNNNAKSIEILTRYTAWTYNLLYWEFGVDGVFGIRVPQWQPAWTYSGTITIDFEWL